VKKTARLISILSLLLLTGVCLAQAQFARSVGGTYYDWGQAVIQTNDGGFAVSGRTESFGPRQYKQLLVKFNPSGTLEWSRTIGGTGEDYGYSLVQTSDGGLVTTGWTSSFGAGYYDVFLTKINPAGVIEWSRAVGGTGRDYGHSVIETSDGGFAVTGKTESYGPGPCGLFLMKFTSAGALEWARTIGGTNEESGNSVVQTNDSGFLVAGYTWTFGAGWSNMLVVKFSSSGDFEWSRTIGGTDSDYGLSVVCANDGGFVVAGYTRSFGSGGNDLFLVKLSSIGSLEWSRAVGGTDDEKGNSIALTSDDGFAVAGETKSFSPGYRGLFIVKFRPAGALEWSRVVGGTGDDCAYSIVQSSDDGFATAGWTESYGPGDRGLFFAKFDAEGNTCLGEEISPTITEITPTVLDTIPSVNVIMPMVTEVTPTINDVTPTFNAVCTHLDIDESVIQPTTFSLSAHPNPFNSAVAISVGEGLKPSRIEIFDVNGRMVYKTPVGATRRVARSTCQPPVDPYEFVWQPDDNITSGVYLVRATVGDGGSVTKRIVYLK